MTKRDEQEALDRRVRAAMSSSGHPSDALEIRTVHGVHSLTNWIRHVVDLTSGEEYAVRVPNLAVEGPLGIVRSEEQALARFAAKAGFGPPVVGCNVDGTMVMPFLTEVHHWSGADVAAQVGGGRLVDTVLSMLTATNFDFVAPTIFDRIGRMFAGAAAVGVPVPGESLLRTRLSTAERARSLDTRFPRSIAHHDLCPNNLLDTGSQLYIIDFEFSGIGDGWLDLATLARVAKLDDVARRTLLRSFGRPDGDEELALLQELGWVSNLFDGMWACIMGALNTRNDIDGVTFDYAAHAQRQFDLLLT